MFKRKIYENLLEWKRESDGKSALLIEGARRIGKSTIVEEFGEMIALIRRNNLFAPYHDRQK